MDLRARAAKELETELEVAPSPRLSLPDEILQLVFYFLQPIVVSIPVTDSRQLPWSCLQVCRQWRGGILARPDNWSNIDFEYTIPARNLDPSSSSPSHWGWDDSSSNPSPDSTRASSPTAEPYAHLSLLRLALDRSRNCRIHLSLRLGKSAELWYSSFIADLADSIDFHAKRVKTLFLQGPPDLIFMSSMQFQSLQSFVTEDYTWQPKPSAILNAPDLQILILPHYLTFQFIAHRIPCQNLRVLEIIQTSLSGKDILLLLLLCPHLRVCVLQYDDLPFTPSSADGRTLQSVLLTSLTVVRRGHFVELPWAYHVSFTQLETYHVRARDPNPCFSADTVCFRPNLENLSTLTLDLSLPPTIILRILKLSRSLSSLHLLKGLPFTDVILQGFVTHLVPFLTTLECTIALADGGSPDDEENPFSHLHSHLDMVASRAKSPVMCDISNLRIIQWPPSESREVDLADSPVLALQWQRGRNITVDGQGAEYWLTNGTILSECRLSMSLKYLFYFPQTE